MAGIGGGSPVLCLYCHGKAAEERRRAERGAEIMADLGTYAETNLRKIGLESKELQADGAKIRAPIRAALDKGASKALLAGNLPERGFGIGGSTGSGKTMALAALVKGYVLSILRRDIPTVGDLEVRSVAWANWIETADTLRKKAVRDPETAEGIIERLSSVPALFLDDLGGEIAKGSYTEDYARGQLYVVIDRRSRSCLPTFYTSNVKRENLIELYGAAFVSRLCGENPFTWVDGVRDQRFEKKDPS